MCKKRDAESCIKFSVKLPHISSDVFLKCKQPFRRKKRRTIILRKRVKATGSVQVRTTDSHLNVDSFSSVNLQNVFQDTPFNLYWKGKRGFFGKL